MEASIVADALAVHWGLPRPLKITPLAGGTNNLVYRVTTPDKEFVLSLAGNYADEWRLRFTQNVLAQLQDNGLPFAVPVFLPTHTSALAASVDIDGCSALATLTRLIPGAAPDRHNLAQTLACGAALGTLDAALARVEVTEDEASSWRSYSDLARCHPLVPDPLEAIATLPVDAAIRQRLADRYTWLVERIPDVYASLPQQLCHEDYDPSNVLIEGERVTGVVDWEFCTRDVRAMDLTVALSWWPIQRLGSGDEWPIMRAFLRGYAQALRLTEPEIEALPLLLRVRSYTSLIHRIGRVRQGISPHEAAIDRARAAIEREEWLNVNVAQLITIAREEMGV